MKADPNQQAAIKHGSGPALVSAGPGSGKTYVLTHRIQFLIQNLGVSPEKILVLTFSKAAAEEMKERFLSLTGQNKTKVTFGTFHSVFLKILKNSGNFGSFRVISETEENFLMQKATKQMHSSLQSYEYADRLLARYHALKAKDQISSYVRDNDSTKKIESIEKRMLLRYEILKKQEGLLDYDDMLYETRKQLCQNPKLLGDVQKRFSFILIDEFQDINPVQYEIIRLIGKKHENIFAVGDDDQSIYAFRGATPAVMKCFLEDYENVKEYHLFRNYRSRTKIVKRAGKLIKKNRDRFRKKINSVSDEAGEVKYRIYANKKKEYRALADDIKKVIQTDKDVKCAILLRTNAVPGDLVQALKNNTIKFCIVNPKTEELTETETDKHTSTEKGYIQKTFAKNAGTKKNISVDYDSVLIMTMHASKGLEFDAVFIPDLYEGNIPYRLSKSREEIEEERRVFYVAMTRAKEKLYLYGLNTFSPKKKTLFKKKTGKYRISRFYINSIF